MAINYKQTVWKLSTETNLNVVNFVPLFSWHFEIWQRLITTVKSATSSFQGYYSRKKPEALTYAHTADKLWGQVRWKLFRSEPVRIRNKLVWRWFSAPPIIHSQTVFFFLFQLITYSNESLVPKCWYAPGSGFPDHFANFVSWVFPLTTSRSSLSAGGRRVRARTCQSRADHSRDPFFLFIYNNTSRLVRRLSTSFVVVIGRWGCNVALRCMLYQSVRCGSLGRLSCVTSDTSEYH